MDNSFFLNAGIPPPMHFGIPHSMPTWHISSETSPECFYNPNWDNQTPHFESALSSMVSSPVASTSNVSNESFVIRELIGKLSNSDMSSINTSCYSTPMNSPPKMKSSMPLSSSVAEFAADHPGFAARFSCFGSRSFNRRNTQGNDCEVGLMRSNGLMGNENNNKLSRVSSSPSLNNLQVINSRQESKSTVVTCSTDFSSRKRKAASKGKAYDPIKVAEASNVSDSNAKRCKGEESAKGSTSSDEKKGKVEPVKDYIHVRARRGEATDSHSLAERVRREKISERMKLLQDLVPGCNKMTGKAVMLDEIINYVQSLQGQVEFLSMKLSSINTRLDFNMDTLISKEKFQQQHSSLFPSDSSAQSVYGHQKNPPHCSVDTLESALCQNLGIQLPSLNVFSEAMPQYPAFGEGDLHTIVQMGVDQISKIEN